MTGLESVADAKGVDPLDLSPPLTEVINPSALDELFWNTHATGRVVFEYSGYEVTVHSDGTVDVHPLPD